MNSTRYLGKLLLMSLKLIAYRHYFQSGSVSFLTLIRPTVRRSRAWWFGRHNFRTSCKIGVGEVVLSSDHATSSGYGNDGADHCAEQGDQDNYLG